MPMMDGVDEGLYDSETPQKPDSKAESVDEQEQMNPESLVDLKVLTGKHGPPKEGDEVVVKVVKIHGDQATIAYAPEKPDEESKESETESDSDMEKLNSEY